MENKKHMNILEIANGIINHRSIEKERCYGPIEESFKKIALMTSLMSNKQITPIDCYNVLISMKLIRQSYNNKDDNDNLLDCVAYMGSLCNFIQNNSQNNLNNNQNNNFIQNNSELTNLHYNKDEEEK